MTISTEYRSVTGSASSVGHSSLQRVVRVDRHVMDRHVHRHGHGAASSVVDGAVHEFFLLVRTGLGVSLHDVLTLMTHERVVLDLLIDEAVSLIMLL